MDNKPVLCSACDPDIGRWHNMFPRRPAEGMLVDSEGHLWSSETGLPKHLKILGVVQAMKDGFKNEHKAK
jgi:hypothetical protein